MYRVLILAVCVGVLVSSEDGEDCVRHENRCDYKASVQRLSGALAAVFRELAEAELDAELPPLGAEAMLVEAPAPDLAADSALAAAIVEKLGRKLALAERELRELRRDLAPGTRSFTSPCPYGALHGPLPVENLIPIGNTTLVIDPEFADTFKDLEIKRRYYLSHTDYATDGKCPSVAHSNLRFLYHKVVHPNRKLLLFLVDNNVSELELQRTISIVKEINRALQATDMIALKITNSTGFVKFEDSCSGDGTSDVGNATEINKLLLREYVSMIEMSSYNLAPATMSKELEELLQRPGLPEHKLIIYFTDNKVIINDTWLQLFPTHLQSPTLKFAVGVLYENNAYTNGSTLGIMHFDKYHNHSQNHTLMKVHINDDVVGQVASAFISLLPHQFSAEKVKLESPIWEATERDFLVPLVIPTAEGVLGLDLYWSDLAEDIIYFERSNIQRRALVFDLSGRVIMHTHFPRPEHTTEKIKFPLLEEAEDYDFIVELREEMLTLEVGSSTRYDHATKNTLTYSWRRAAGRLVACVVSVAGSAGVKTSVDKEDDDPPDAPAPRDERDILLHRLDLLPPRGGRLCRHFKRLATVERGTVYLAPSAFRAPFSYLREAGAGHGARRLLQNYAAYLRSVARGLLANPGLRPLVQRRVRSLLPLLALYRRRALAGPRASRVVRRYAAAPDGVLVAFPGAVLDHRYEPSRRGWFATATARPGVVTLSPPALDAGGAGYVVTLAVRSGGAVRALDLPAGYVRELLPALEPACRAPRARCFLVNAAGYLVAHPSPAAEGGAAERRHLTRREALVAADMLARGGPVHKMLCRSLHDGTTQRYYSMGAAPGAASAAPGEHCARYQLAPVAGTDTLVAIVNASCGGGAFCPCSTVDRLCLNCRRMERTECECPCECGADRCAARASPPPPLCPPALEAGDHEAHHYGEELEDLQPCFDFRCEEHETRSECVSAAGCEWCALRRDGAPLSAPRCAPLAACWGGVLGALTPYGEGPGGAGEGAARSALGPAAAALLALALALGAGAYCYRAGAGTRGVDSPWPEADVRLSRLAEEAAAEASAREGRDRLLPAEEAPVSPYKVLTGCRRARHAGSDHGYSTMTPHEDSEAAGGSATEPAPLSDDTRSDVSCPLPRPAPRLRPPPTPLPGLTALPAHSVLAPVTVHRHMEAS